MRIVIDTKIWIAGLLWNGKARELLRLAEKGLLKFCMTYQMVLELEEVLSYPRFQSRLAILGQSPASLTAIALGLSTTFEITRTGIPIVQTDPDDDIFLLCAVEATAAYVVTNDKHLLALNAYSGISIITLDEFWDREIPGLKSSAVLP